MGAEVRGDPLHIEDRAEGGNPGIEPLPQRFAVRQEGLQATEGDTHESDVLRSSRTTGDADLLGRVDRAPSLAKRIEVDGACRLASYRRERDQAPARGRFGAPRADPTPDRHPHP